MVEVPRWSKSVTSIRYVMNF